MNPTTAPVIAALTTDAWLVEQIVRAAALAGAQTLVTETADTLWRAFDRWPALVIVDMAAPDWEKPVRWAKNQPHTRAIPIVAFSQRIDAENTRLASAAGCSAGLTAADLLTALPGLLDDALHPRTRWHEGWDTTPPPALCHGIEQFNAGEYWECHETLETAWVAERRPIRDLYQGVLQVGVAFHHLQHRNYAGALKLLRRGLPRLRDLPEICQGVHVAELVAAARTIHDEVVALGPDRIDTLNLTTLPKIAIVGCL